MAKDPTLAFLTVISKDVPTNQWRNCSFNYAIDSTESEKFHQAFDFFKWLRTNIRPDSKFFLELKELLANEGRNDLVQKIVEYESKYNPLFKYNIPQFYLIFL
jgi:hypothetical protein